MALDNWIIQRSVCVIADGTAAGTSGVLDTSGYKYVDIYTIGTTGSCTTNVYTNAGTLAGTSATTMPYLVLIGSHTAVGSSGGEQQTTGIATANQGIVTHSDITGTYSTFVVEHD